MRYTQEAIGQEKMALPTFLWVRSPHLAALTGRPGETRWPS